MIHVQDVGVSIDQTVLLEPTSLSVARGTVIAVRGSNGSGKTTLLQVLCGQIEATTGQQPSLVHDQISETLSFDEKSER